MDKIFLTIQEAHTLKQFAHILTNRRSKNVKILSKILIQFSQIIQNMLEYHTIFITRCI